jgi:uncharacterized protein YjbI with pentapeptide repeats
LPTFDGNGRPGVFLASAFLAGAFFAGAFLAGAFFAGAFLTGAFFIAAFLAGAFLAAAFLAGAFLAGAFFAGTPRTLWQMPKLSNFPLSPKGKFFSILLDFPEEFLD